MIFSMYSHRRFVFSLNISGQHEQAATALFWIFNGQKSLAMLWKNPLAKRS